MSDETLLSVEGVSIAYGGRHVLTDASFHLKRGEIVMLCGGNGSGKSSLFKVIAGMTAPTRGRVLFAGKDITALPPWRRARLGLRWVAQRSLAVPSLRVDEYASVANALLRRTVSSRLRSGGFTEEIDRHRDACVAQLSTGQLRRIYLSVMMSWPGKVLLLDEPSAGVARGFDARLREVVKSIAAHGSAVCFIEHDRHRLGDCCTRILTIEGGHLAG